MAVRKKPAKKKAAKKNLPQDNPASRLIDARIAQLGDWRGTLDPAGLFNSSLEGHTRRAIDFPMGAKPDEKAFKTLVRAAVAHNTSRGK